MSSGTVAEELVALCRAGKFAEAVEQLYAEDAVSVEAMDFNGQGREVRGKAAIRAKGQAWFADNDVHHIEVSGPFVSPERFVVQFIFDFTRRANGERVRFPEAAVYEVREGKIAREEFLYGVPS